MHELSIARAVVAEVTAALADRRDPVVERLRLRVGRLSGIDARALGYGFEFARAGTICESAELDVEHVAVRIRCAPCDAVVETDGAHVRCPDCNTPSADIRTGRDLTIVDITLRDHETRSSREPRGARNERRDEPRPRADECPGSWGGEVVARASTERSGGDEPRPRADECPQGHEEAAA